MQDYESRISRVNVPHDNKGDFYTLLLDALSERESFLTEEGSEYWSEGSSLYKDPIRAAADVWGMTANMRTVGNVYLRKARGVDCKGLNVVPYTGGDGTLGFADVSNAKGVPQVHISSMPYEKADSRIEALDVYCGVTLHEVSHLINTPNGWDHYTGGKNASDFTLPTHPGEKFGEGDIKTMAALWNLIEDERIETKVREDVPNLARYINCAMRLVFEASNWSEATPEDLPDVDRVMHMACSLLRAPHMITDEDKEFAMIDGSKPFEELRKRTPRMSESQDDSVKIGTDIYLYIREQHEQYSDPNNTDPRAEAQRAADKAKEEYDKAMQEYMEGLKKFQELLDTGGQQNPGEKPSRNPGQGFGASDMSQLSDAMEGTDEPMEGESAEAMAQTGEDSQATTRQWTALKGSESSSILAVRPKGEEAKRYQRIRSEVANSSRAMQSIFEFRVGERVTHLKGEPQGRLDRSRLAKATFSEFIFEETQTEIYQDFAQLLLIDQSGSMCGDREDAALRLSTCMYEASIPFPQIQTDVYSYTNDGSSNVLRVLKTQRHGWNAIGAYRAHGYNVDYVSIDEAAEYFSKTYPNHQKVIWVISDGQPNNGSLNGYEGTRAAVAKWRRRGVSVFGIGICGCDVSNIYGNRMSIQFKDTSTFIPEMRRRIVPIVMNPNVKAN